MSWNGNGGDQGPWGQRPQNPQQPDVEQLLRAAREKFGGGNSGMPGGSKGWMLLAAIAFMGWMATGIYVVAPDEVGVVVRFGKYVETTTPGPHLHLPYPIESVTKPKVTQIQRIELGYRTRGRTSMDVPTESLMLTGDENIIDIDLSIQYRIKDGADYLFNVNNPARDPSKVVRQATETTIREVIGKNSIDEALTTGKSNIQALTKLGIQKILDKYQSGIDVVAVQLQQVQPPEEVIHAFKDVASAREDKERSVNEAQGYANDILPKAKGQAARIVQEAKGYKEAKVSRAGGDANRFISLYNEYKKAKDVTRARLYLETMEEVMGRTNKVILDNDAGRNVLPYLPLGQQGMVSGQTAPQMKR
uniref:Protein HflK n=1 Tax=Magnetococcus massalia (strain MO-1) TaxID=451514 RepID=A0A1S7LEF6_MAGMO|nr:Protease activity modulator HflK [Candidatus Magnetococcus massalia]